MKFRHFIPTVNRLDLTRLAVDAVLPILGDAVTLIDNTEHGDIASCPSAWEPAQIYRPDVPLWTNQTMNLMRAIAIREQLDVFGFQHNDGEPPPETVRAVYAKAEELNATGERWGVIFSQYDVCCVFNTAAVAEVGPWNRFLLQYFLDNEYYDRLERAGYPAVDLKLPCTHHNDASSTIKSDRHLEAFNSVYFPICELIYRRGLR